MTGVQTCALPILGTGRELVQVGHFAARDVAAWARQLEDAVGRLQAEAAQRRQRLQQAQEAQQSLMEVRGCDGAQKGGGWS